MQEVWLKTNRRAILFGLAVPLVIMLVGVLLIAASGSNASLQRWIGSTLLLAGAALVLALVQQWRRPRIAFQGGQVLFYLRGRTPIAVSVDVVEAFFAGQSPAHLPVLTKQPQSVNLIARLARRHTEWTEQSVKPALGQWSDSYVTIRGTWCEPLGAEVIRRLNRRLKEVKDEISAGPND
jgi:hypothetical protein